MSESHNDAQREHWNIWREKEREGRKIKLGWRKQKDEGPTCRVGAITIVKKRGRTVFPDIFSPGVNFPPYSNPR